ncbi:MAG TPA: phage terminase large subunit family protein, partial [Thermodesulfobacteriota bacterium]|nr:phage terminase large subunit family protein [Thermodesulfobacteriota bacterium]
MQFTEKELEFIKCAKDPAYFLDTYGYVFNAKEQGVTPMTCFEYQKDCIEKFHKYRNNIVLKSRQTGLSVITAGYIAWRVLFRKDERILIIANDGAGARRFLKTVKQFLDYTPQWLKPDSEIINNQTKIEFSNGSWAEAKASSPDAGRGDSLTMLVLDETAFIKDADAIWMAAGMALSTTKGKCVMISTPNGTGNLYHKTWVAGEKRGYKKESDFVLSKVHWTENPFANENLEMRTDESGEENWWSPWYESQCDRLHWDSVKIAQELDLSFEGSKRLAIPPE